MKLLRIKPTGWLNNPSFGIWTNINYDYPVKTVVTSKHVSSEPFKLFEFSFTVNNISYGAELTSNRTVLFIWRKESLTNINGNEFKRIEFEILKKFRLKDLD